MKIDEKVRDALIAYRDLHHMESIGYFEETNGDTKEQKLQMAVLGYKKIATDLIKHYIPEFMKAPGPIDSQRG